MQAKDYDQGCRLFSLLLLPELVPSKAYKFKSGNKTVIVKNEIKSFYRYVCGKVVR